MEKLVSKSSQRTPRRNKTTSDTATTINGPMRRVDLQKIQKAAQRARSSRIPTSQSKRSGQRRDINPTIRQDSVNAERQRSDRYATTDRTMPRNAPLSSSQNPWSDGDETVGTEVFLGPTNNDAGSENVRSANRPFGTLDPEYFNPFDLNAGQPDYYVPELGLNFVNFDTLGNSNPFQDANSRGHQQDPESLSQKTSGADDLPMSEQVIGDMLLNFLGQI